MLNRYSMRCRGLVLWLAAAVVCHPAMARTLLVGPLRDLATPSEASWVAADGDTILIDPGSYTDCAVWRASHLTIAVIRACGRFCSASACTRAMKPAPTRAIRFTSLFPAVRLPYGARPASGLARGSAPWVGPLVVGPRVISCRRHHS